VGPPLADDRHRPRPLVIPLQKTPLKKGGRGDPSLP